jgi:hypothetical protein
MSEENARPEVLISLPGLHPAEHEDATSITNDAYRQQVENHANQRSTELAKDSTATGELFVQGQSYRTKGEPAPTVRPEDRWPEGAQ